MILEHVDMLITIDNKHPSFSIILTKMSYFTVYINIYNESPSSFQNFPVE